MFGIGPLELVVLALVGLIVLGPERLPEITKDAVRMLRTLRELASGARTQLKNELGPELADMDLSALRELRNLNPRTAVTRALLGEDQATVSSWLNGAPPSTSTSGPATVSGQPMPPAPSVPMQSMPQQSMPQQSMPSQAMPQQSVPQQMPVVPRPLGRGEAAPYDADAT